MKTILYSLHHRQLVLILLLTYFFRLVKNLTRKHTIEPNRIAVCVSTVTNDTRIYEVPKMTVAALAFTQKAKERYVSVTYLNSSSVKLLIYFHSKFYGG